MNRRTWVALSIVLLLCASVVAYAQVQRQPLPPAQTGLYQFVAKPLSEPIAGIAPDAASLYRCNIITGEVEVLVASGGGGNRPFEYFWQRVIVRNP